jgi:hypothetical protein
MTCAGALLAGLAGTALYGWQSEHQKVENLQAQIEDLEKQVMRSTVDRSVSRQMEEIANEQREISDEKREEALQQTKVANEMRLRSELERQNALIAEKNAVASEKKAIEASEVAENERKLAEHQRLLAEMSKQKADTLSYIALGRSLGSISTIQAQAGNEDVANLLSYASYLYTQRYGGDIFYPAVFQSLMQSSKSMTSWTEHTGAVMNLEYMPGDDNRLVSVSNYGEILLNQRQGDRLLTKVLLKNNNYDFRDVIISKTGRIYAVSRTGHLAIIQEDLKTVKIIDLDKIEHPMRLHDISENNLLIIGENSIGLFDMKRNIIRGTRALGFHVIKGSRKSGLPLLFDNQGKMHLVSGLDNMKTEDVPVTGTVTAYCESKNTGIEAYGMSDGTIWLIQKDGKKQKLLGHRSRISKMKLNGRRLFSSSYDGKVNLWITDKEKIEPMTLIETKNWIMHFNFDSTKTTFWMGDAKGGLTAVNISVPIMVNSVKQKLTRNLTADEWNYFIGQSVPYESFIVKSE